MLHTLDLASPASATVLAVATSSAFATTVRSRVLVLAAADETVRRNGAFTLVLPFLVAALLRVWDFAEERVDTVLGSLVSRRHY